MTGRWPSGFGPVLLWGLCFPSQTGGSDLPSPAPLSPQPLLGAAGARSHGLSGHRDPKAGAGPAGGGGLTSRPPCPVPFPWDWCSQPLSWPCGPSCDSGFLEEAREGTEDSPPPDPGIPPAGLPVPSSPLWLHMVGLTSSTVPPPPEGAPFCWHPTPHIICWCGDRAPPHSLARPRTCQSKHFPAFISLLGSAVRLLSGRLPVPVCWELPCGTRGRLGMPGALHRNLSIPSTWSQLCWVSLGDLGLRTSWASVFLTGAWGAWSATWTSQQTGWEVRPWWHGSGHLSPAAASCPVSAVCDRVAPGPPLTVTKGL